MSVFFNSAKEILTNRDFSDPFGYHNDQSYKQTRLPGSGEKKSTQRTIVNVTNALGYLPVIGTIIGIFRIYKSISHLNSKNFNINDLGDKAFSIAFGIRGALEVFVPLIGTLALDIIVSSIRFRNQMLQEKKTN